MIALWLFLIFMAVWLIIFIQPEKKISEAKRRLRKRGYSV